MRRDARGQALKALVQPCSLVSKPLLEKPTGKLLPEMILVCNNLRNDLSHPNEYVRCTAPAARRRFHQR